MTAKARIAVLGAGWWGAQVYIPSLLADPRVDLVAVNRRDPAALKELTDHFGIAKGYTDYRELLAVEKPDGVVIVSPHTVHFEQGMAALDAGAHLLVDKPLCTNATDARALVTRADALGRQIVVPYGWNFKDFTRRAADLVRGGRIGEVRHVVCQMASATADLFGGTGLIETKDHMFKPNRDTWADPSKAGGYGWGQLSHALGLMFGIVDLAPVSVYAATGQSPAGVDYYDAAVVRLANGATVALSGAGTMPKGSTYQVDVRIFGTEGMLLLDMERARMVLRRDDGTEEVPDLAPDSGAYQCIEPTARLADICLGLPVRNEAPGIVGQRAVEVLDAMYRSAASGRLETV
jgi:predicted dehydrogenase